MPGFPREVARPAPAPGSGGPQPRVSFLGIVACCALGTALLGSPAGVQTAAAQTVRDQAGLLAEENALPFLLPLAEGLGFSANAGLFDRAKAAGFLRFDVATRISGAVTPLDRRRFDARAPLSVSIAFPGGGERSYSEPYRPQNGASTTASVSGSGRGVVLEPQGEFREALLAAGLRPEDHLLRFPDGLGISIVSSLSTQLSIGLGLGTEVMIRFLPSFELGGKVGEVRASGWGIKHHLNRWVRLPLDLSLQGGEQSLDWGGVLEGEARELGILVGRTLGPLSLYGTAGARSADLSASYSVLNPAGLAALPPDGTPVQFQASLEPTLATGFGFRMQFLLLNLSGQYLSSDYDTYSLKVGMGLP